MNWEWSVSLCMVGELFIAGLHRCDHRGGNGICPSVFEVFAAICSQRVLRLESLRYSNWKACATMGAAPSLAHRKCRLT